LTLSVMGRVPVPGTEANLRPLADPEMMRIELAS